MLFPVVTVEVILLRKWLSTYLAGYLALHLPMPPRPCVMGSLVMPAHVSLVNGCA